MDVVNDLINRVLEGEDPKNVIAELIPRPRTKPKKRVDPRRSAIAKKRFRQNRAKFIIGAKKAAKTKGKAFFKRLGQLAAKKRKRSSEAFEISSWLREQDDVIKDLVDILLNGDDELVSEILDDISKALSDPENALE